MGAGRHDNPRLAQGIDFACRVGARVLDERAGMTHAPSDGRVLADHERDDRLPASRGSDVLGSLLLLGAADLADQHDRLRLRIGEEQREAIDEAHAVNRVAADTDGRRLAETGGCQLTDHFARQ